MIKSVIFDLDGTLLDTSEGIISSVEKMIDHFGYKKLTRAELETFIGPPISKSVIRIYGLSYEEALEAMKYYRVVYKAEPEDGSKPDLFRGSI
jgi:phosphoglycolate phosphatase